MLSLSLSLPPSLPLISLPTQSSSFNSCSCLIFTLSHSLSISTVPTVPNSVTITSRIGSLIVQWDPPDLLNAPAITYTIIYSTTDSPSESNSTVTSDTIVVINDLAAFTEYSVVVQACSSVGCGSFTTPETERTQEEGAQHRYVHTYVYMKV